MITTKYTKAGTGTKATKEIVWFFFVCFVPTWVSISRVSW